VRVRSDGTDARIVSISGRTSSLRFHDIALFASLIIRLFQLVFLTGTVFFSYNKSAGRMFRLIFSAKRTGPILS